MFCAGGRVVRRERKDHKYFILAIIIFLSTPLLLLLLLTHLSLNSEKFISLSLSLLRSMMNKIRREKL
jgi:hypothetical protein